MKLFNQSLICLTRMVAFQVSHGVRAGDKVSCTISELQPLRAEPEDIPLDIVFEDEHVLVVNKPAHMVSNEDQPFCFVATSWHFLLFVTENWNQTSSSAAVYCWARSSGSEHRFLMIQVVHPAPGNAFGTLVNAILHHCSLPTVAFSEKELPEAEDAFDSDDESSSLTAYQSSAHGGSSNLYGGSVRPGIVHRLDKGTSGLLVVAKVLFLLFSSPSAATGSILDMSSS